VAPRRRATAHATGKSDTCDPEAPEQVRCTRASTTNPDKQEIHDTTILQRKSAAKLDKELRDSRSAANCEEVRAAARWLNHTLERATVCCWCGFCLS